MDTFSFRLFSTFFLTLGLLKFGFDAPGILKNIIGSMDDALKGKFNGLSAFNEMKSNASKVIDGTKKIGANAKKFGQTVGKGAKAVGKGAQKLGSGATGLVGGGIAGSIRGFKNGLADYQSMAKAPKTKIGAVGQAIGGAFHSVGASLTGGLAGSAKGAAASFKNPSWNMHNQLMLAAEQGGIMAQKQSQFYRDGKSNNPFKRIANRAGNGVKDFWNDTKEQAQEFGQTVYGGATTNEARTMSNNIKSNNTAAMSATGTDKAIENLKAAKDKNLEKFREMKLTGASADDIASELNMDTNALGLTGRNEDLKKISDEINSKYSGAAQTQLMDKFNSMKSAGASISSIMEGLNDEINEINKTATTKVDAIDKSSLGLGTTDRNDDLKKLSEAIDKNFKDAKKAEIADKFEKMNDENKKIISEYNKESLKTFKENISAIGEDDKIALRDALAKSGICSNSGNVDADLQQAAKNLEDNMDYANMTSSDDCAQNLLNFEKLQTELGKISKTIDNREALKEYKKKKKKSGEGNDDSSKGGTK